MFIELTLKDCDEKVLINVNNIESITNGMVHFRGYCYQVKESYEEICMRIDKVLRYGSAAWTR